MTEIRLPINTEHDVVTGVLRAGEYCRELGFGEAEWRLIATAVSELARNTLKYANTGSVRLRELHMRGRTGVEIVAQDSGPGIDDIETAMTDAYSTSGTLGLGLPGVKRMMDEFDIRSESGKGLRVTARKWL
jgi:serine/threonine-protein kinase RsbT